MKKRIFGLWLCLLIGVAHAEPSGLAAELPRIPEGSRASTYPVPRTDWVEKVAALFAESRRKAAQIEVILDGDSITAGFRKEWAKHFPKVKAFNFAMIGDRTQHLLWRLSQGQLEGLRPKVVVLLIGTNNLGLSESVADTVEGIRAVVAEYRRQCPEAVLILQGLFPRGRGPGTPFLPKVKAVNEAISTLHDGKNVFYVDFGARFLTAEGEVDAVLLPDYLHPKEKGYTVWAEALRPVLARVLEPVAQ